MRPAMRAGWAGCALGWCDAGCGWSAARAVRWAGSRFCMRMTGSGGWGFECGALSLVACADAMVWRGWGTAADARRLAEACVGRFVG